jgi:hypothetical protein
MDGRKFLTLNADYLQNWNSPNMGE